MIKGVFVINNHGKPRLIKDFQRMVRALLARCQHVLWVCRSKRGVCCWLLRCPGAADTTGPATNDP
jgi:hypothetical protein